MLHPNKQLLIYNNSKLNVDDHNGMTFPYIIRKGLVHLGASGQMNWRRRPLGQATLPGHSGQGPQGLPEIKYAHIEMYRLFATYLQEHADKNIGCKV